MEKELLVFLLRKHMEGRLENSERAELAAFFNRRQSREIATAVLEEMLLQSSSMPSVHSDQRFDSLIAGILQADSTPDNEEAEPEAEVLVPRKSRAGKRVLGTVAAFLVLAAAALYFFYYKEGKFGADNAGVNSVANDLAPGGKLAKLPVAMKALRGANQRPRGGRPARSRHGPPKGTV